MKLDCTCPPQGRDGLCEVHGLPAKERARTRKFNNQGARRKPLARTSEKQELLDERWAALREMFIWLTKRLGAEQENFCCEECGRWAPPRNHGYQSDGLWGEADHEIPRSKSGHYRADNFVWRCAGRDDSCHRLKHGVPWPERRREDRARSTGSG